MCICQNCLHFVFLCLYAALYAILFLFELFSKSLGFPFQFRFQYHNSSDKLSMYNVCTKFSVLIVSHVSLARIVVVVALASFLSFPNTLMCFSALLLYRNF
jgi:hypothetical protein